MMTSNGITGDGNLLLQFHENFGKKPECLRGQVVWITGASSGIGEALAYRLARAGCKLLLSARREDELNRVRNACIALPGKILMDDIVVLPMDLLNIDHHRDVASKAIEYFGKVDILVNNAARAQLSLIRDTDLEVDREVINLNCLAQISLTKSLLPHWMERRSGHVVVTSSTAGKIGIPYAAAYTASKFALHGFFEAFRIEHWQHNIAVTIACPGATKTNIGEFAFTGNIDQMMGKIETSHEGEKGVMTSERCAELMSIAAANCLSEVWITKQYLLLHYMAQYCPKISTWVLIRYGYPAIDKSMKDFFKKKAASH